ncbi:MAG: hypothetical protein J6X55_04525, partial [Victivallales bacterium]|nr:hypothetical protein [Victivallales bacterium]
MRRLFTVLVIASVCLLAENAAQDTMKVLADRTSSCTSEQEIQTVTQAILQANDLSNYQKGNLLYSVGMKCKSLKFHDLLLDTFKQSIELKNTRWPGAEAHLETARELKRRQKYDDARSHYLIVFNTDAFPHGQRCYAGLEMFDLESELDNWEKAADYLRETREKIKPVGSDEATLLWKEAVLQSHLGNKEEALKLFLAAANHPNAKPHVKSHSWNGAAQLAYDAKNINDACRYLQNAQWPSAELKRHLEELTAEAPFGVMPIFPAEKLHPRLQYYVEHKIRGAWGAGPGSYRTPSEPTIKETGFDPSKYSFEVLDDISKQGYNMVMSLFGPWKGGPGELHVMEDWARFWAIGCRNHHLDCLSVIQFSQCSGTYRKFYDGAGKTAVSQVCPADWNYWEKEILSRALISAKVGLEVPAMVGTVLDFEMYVRDGSNYPGPCLCNACFSEFLSLTKDKSPQPPAEKRLEWIKSRNLFKRYCDYSRWKMTDTCRKVERGIHKVNPDFIIAYVPFFEWFQGCTRGLGTPEMPTLLLSEMEYSVGYTPSIKKRTERLAKEGYPALYAAGIWNFKFPAETIAGHLYRMAEDSHGMWVYTVYPFAEAKLSPDGTSTKLYKGSTWRDYYKAMRLCNNALDMKLIDPDYKPSFKLPEIPDLPPPKLELTALSTPIVIDGTLDDSGWKDAPEITLINNANGSTMKIAPRIKLAFDNSFFYVGAVMNEPDMTALKTQVTIDNDFAIFSDDILELFLGFDDNSKVAHWGINSNGNVGQHMVFVAGQDRNWRSDAIIKTTKHANHWILEAAFPWSNLTPSLVGECTFNATMSRRYQPNSAWSPTFGLYMNP